MGIWTYDTPAGPATIEPFFDSCGDDRYRLVFDGDVLGLYDSPRQALAALVAGTCLWSSAGDLTKFGFPRDLSGWGFRPLSEARFAQQVAESGRDAPNHE
jgi:hypothetical protein